MKIIKQPSKNQWQQIIQRPVQDLSSLSQKVQAILDDVKLNGDSAVKKYTKQFDCVDITEMKVTRAEIDHADTLLSDDIKKAIEIASSNIYAFHQKQITASEIIETMPGIQCWRKSVAIEKVGLYIPGGTAPLFSTILMLGIPAKIAGCKQIVLCSPPGKNGEMHPAILYAANKVGIADIYKTGGVQAIAAMAYGTETIPQLYKIFGPGNQYVTSAKQLIQQQGIAIDMPAGPSEVCVLADDAANPAYVAADLLAQAEHGADSQVMLVASSSFNIDDCLKQLKKQLELLPRKEIASKALENSRAVIFSDDETAIHFINEYAPEHLIICCKNEDAVAEKIINAGSVFIGNYSPESVGDYASGTNHTLPTNGFAKAYSGVSVDSFVKKITYQKLNKNGLENIADTVIQMAETEGLQAHANAVRVRM